MHSASLTTLLTGLLIGLAAPHLTASDWPQWRGPHRNGQYSGPAWPTDLKTLELAWKVPLSPSYSGPIVSGSRVFTTESEDRKYEVASAYDHRSGERLWQKRWEGAVSVPFFAKSNGDWIRSTPACDGDNLYVAGMRDVLMSLDVISGEINWRLDFVAALDAPIPDFGFVSSPLVTEDSVFVQAGASVIRVNKKSGGITWRSLTDSGGMWGSAFSSPILTTIANREQLVVQTRQDLAGLDPADGSVLWTQPVKAFRGMNITTPLVHDDLLFTSTYGGRTMGFRVGRTGASFAVSPAWTYKSQGYMTTPVVVDGVAYHHLRSQRFVAIDLSSGTELWTSDRSFGKYLSLVAQRDRILALDQTGSLYLIRANPDRFEVIDERKLTDDSTWAHLAIADNHLYVRELNALTAYQWKL